jgi:hypothetical protein
MVRLASVAVVAWNVALVVRFTYQFFAYGQLNLADGLGWLAYLLMSTVLVLRGVRGAADRVRRDERAAPRRGRAVLDHRRVRPGRGPALEILNDGVRQPGTRAFGGELTAGPLTGDWYRLRVEIPGESS